MSKILVVLLALTLTACEEPTPEDEAEQAQRHSGLACDHFRNVMGDVSNGVLTPEEMRTKLKEVEGDANIATPEVQAAATAMLRAATQDDGEGLVAAVEDMHEACKAAGH